MKVNELLEAKKPKPRKLSKSEIAKRARWDAIDAAKAKRGKIEISQAKTFKEINNLALTCITGASSGLKAEIKDFAANDAFYVPEIDEAVKQLDHVFNDSKSIEWGSGIDYFEEAVFAVAERIVDYYDNKMNFEPGTHRDVHIGVQRSKVGETEIVAAIKRITGKDITKESVELSESLPKVHDLSHLKDKGSGDDYDPYEQGAYDETQTNDDIKDGDVLNLGKGRTGVMVKAWPVAVAGDHSGTHFHKLAKGTTWDDFEDGKYKEAAKHAKHIAGVKEAILSESAGDRMKREAMKLKRETDIQGYLKKMIEYSEHMSDAMMSNAQQFGKLTYQGRSYARKSKKFDADAKKFREELRGFGE